MATETETHYITRVVVERVQKTIDKTHPHSEPTIGREVIELGNYTIRDTDLDNMKGRVTAIMSIMEDI